ncbi:MAG: HEPN domain-containing protein [Candidatus Sulfotelmatobacter sp.]
MDKFESTGYWYLPARPEHQVVGILRHDEEGIRLSLTGGFSEFTLGSFQSENYPLIHGVVDEHPGGTFVTLLNSILVSQKIRMPGVDSQVIRAETALVGQSLLDEGDLVFTGCRVRFSHLDAWFEQLNFSDEFLTEDQHVIGYTATYHKQAAPQLRLGNRSFHFASAFSLSKDAQSITMTACLHVVSEQFEPLDLDRLTREVIRPVQELISFATDTPNSIPHLAVWHGDTDLREERASFSVFRSQVLDPWEHLDGLDREDMLFTYRDALDCGFDLFHAWGLFRDKFETFCSVYFGHQAAPLKFLEDKFLRIVHELQLFFRLAGLRAPHAAEVQQWIDSLPPEPSSPEKRHWLVAIIPDASDLSLPWNLRHALRENAAIVAPLMNKDPDAFVDQVLATLVYIAHRDNEEEPASERREVLYYLIQRLSILLKVCILRQVGFQPKWISRVLSQNKNINFLKTVRD